MSRFNDFKAIIFSDPRSKEALTKAIRDKGYSAADFKDAFEKLIHKVEERDLQTTLAPFLRALAIRHLREGKKHHRPAKFGANTMLFSALQT